MKVVIPEGFGKKVPATKSGQSAVFSMKRSQPLGWLLLIVRTARLAYLMPTADTRKREFGVLEEVRDNHPKLVLSLDPVAVEHPGGIRHAHVVDFLMGS